ncbi:MAG: flavin reductase family protein [Clostridia bacterium]|nr:flavin reductase family protein [Clostridia bacterium]
MSRIHWKGSALLAPVPSVMVTCGTAEKANIITVGWCGVVSTRPARVSISIRPERHSHAMIKETGNFVINLTPASLAEVCDYCGTVTGRCVDKVKKTGLTLIPSESVDAPTIADCPLALECRVSQVIPLGSHDCFIADVVGVSVDEQFVDASGKLRLDTADLLVYVHGEYFRIGKKLGKIGISVENKKKGRFANVKAVEKAKPSPKKGK